MMPRIQLLQRFDLIGLFQMISMSPVNFDGALSSSWVSQNLIDMRGLIVYIAS
jgi:hypothetical protein